MPGTEGLGAPGIVVPDDLGRSGLLEEIVKDGPLPSDFLDHNGISGKPLLFLLGVKAYSTAPSAGSVMGKPAAFTDPQGERCRDPGSIPGLGLVSGAVAGAREQ